MLDIETLYLMLEDGEFKTGKKIPDGNIVLLLVSDEGFVFGYLINSNITFKKPIYISPNGEKVFNFSKFSYFVSDFTEDVFEPVLLAR